MNLTELQQKRLALVRPVKRMKCIAFRKTLDITEKALTDNDPNTYKLVWDAFQEYERLSEQEDKLMQKVPEFYNLLYVLMVAKNIKDIYWRLPDHVKLLWNKNLELKEWGDQYS